jgi:hypothetical protein
MNVSQLCRHMLLDSIGKTGTYEQVLWIYLLAADHVLW